jgi:hypothetical protein
MRCRNRKKSGLRLAGSAVDLLLEVGPVVGSQIPLYPSGILLAPTSDLRRPQETLRSLLGGELEMRCES